MAAAATRPSGTAGWVDVGEGVRLRPLVEGEGTALVLYRIDPGLEFLPHSHPFPEYGTVVLGRGRLILDGEVRRLREGDSYYVPAGVRHGWAVPAGGSPVVMLHVAVDPASGADRHMAQELVDRTREVIRRAKAAASPRASVELAWAPGSTP